MKNKIKHSKKMEFDESHIPNNLIKRYGVITTKIGKGQFGEVWKTSRGFAVKVMDGDSIESFIKEASLMKYIKSPYCMEILDAYIRNNANLEYDENVFYIVMPLGEGLEGFKVPKNHEKRFSELVQGVFDLHTQDVIHGDIKPENCVLVDGKIRLSDFGLSNFHACIQKKLGNNFQTLFWRSPNLLLGQDNQLADDIWALGVILYHWETGRLPFFPDKFTAKDQLEEIFKELGTPTTRNWPGLVDLPDFKTVQSNYKPNPKFFDDLNPYARSLVQHMLSMNPLDRPTIQEIMNHPYFNKIKTKELVSIDCHMKLMSSMNQELTNTFAPGNQPHENNYCTLLDWLYTTMRKSSNLLAFGHGVTLIQWMLNNKKISTDKLQLVGSVVMYISSILFEYSYSPDEWVYLSARVFTSQDFHRALGFILGLRNFDLCWSSAMSFVYEKYPYTHWESRIADAAQFFLTSWYMTKYSVDKQGEKIIELYRFADEGLSISEETKKDISIILKNSKGEQRKVLTGLLKKLDYEA